MYNICEVEHMQCFNFLLTKYNLNHLLSLIKEHKYIIYHISYHRNSFYFMRIFWAAVLWKQLIL